MDELAIIEVNNLLQLVETYLLTDGDITYLDALGENPIDTCGYYNTAQIVLEKRASYDTTMQSKLEALQAFAALDSCTLTLEPEVVPDVDIPVFCGGL